jgi:hypothetical protein
MPESSKNRTYRSNERGETMYFDPNKYENVKHRKLRFYKDYPDGRIIAEMINPDTVESYALFKATVYKNVEDLEKMLPFATGYAFELRETDLSISKEGRKYESVNFTSWTENAEESAVGRALDNAGYSSNGKCSQEEMEKAQRMSSKPPIEEDNDLDTPQVLGFGKHSRETWQEIPHDYLVWIYENQHGQRRALAEKELERRSDAAKAM